MKPKIPFSDISAEGWQNLAIFAILIFYLAQTGADLFWQNTCGHLAIDYCAFWSAGQVANQHGYPSVYDLQLLTQHQMPLFPRPESFHVIPVPYLAVFILPFQLLSLLDVATGFWIWTLINLVAYVWYLRFFVRATTGKPLSLRLSLLLALSLPFFNNLYIGQVNVWFMICVGEFMRLMMSNRPFQAGLWLGGLLLKPQMLMLILPFAVLYHSWKVLAGFAALFILILGASLALTGMEGMTSLFKLSFGYVRGMPTNGPELMMNWRMIGVNLSWPLAISGMIASGIAVLYVWWKDAGRYSSLCLLATIAGTLTLSWHSHVATSVALIPILIYLYLKNDLLKKVFLSWVFIPVAVTFIIYTLGALMKTQVLPPGTAQVMNFLTGMNGLAFSLYFLALTVMDAWRTGWIAPARE